ncbi:Xaa-Pro dipeptidase [Marinomonas sp. 42_23_T18]|nr:Xaa-Pro dipeptidase [Marinomonas sp. 42_23_T18]
MPKLYSQHLEILATRYRKVMQTFDLDSIIISSGHKTYYFQDDYTHTFHAFSGAQQWLPFSLCSDVYILLNKEDKPLLFWPKRDDFWHSDNCLPEGDWSDLWQTIEARKDYDILSHLGKKHAWIGPKPDHIQANFNRQSELEAAINYHKAYKTEYEIEAVYQANLEAVAGHKAAEKAFIEGKSELTIYHDYLNASHQGAVNEPYPGIMALNQNAAILHYDVKSHQPQSQSHTLLIDAGANHKGYASDITRTFSQDTGLFKAMLDSMEELQLSLCEHAVAGIDFNDLHNECVTGVAKILAKHKICNLSVEEQLEKRIPQVFFPHGLGHLLGLQVHDLGGHQIDEAGTIQSPSDNAPFLRLTRRLEENMVITIEPGLYFIPMLLEKMQAEIKDHGCDLELIESLKHFGGIRIEDNLVIGKESPRNLTREAFATLA